MSTKIYKFHQLDDTTNVEFSRNRRNIVCEGSGGCRANYKEAVAEHVRGGAKTEVTRLRQKTRGC